MDNTDVEKGLAGADVLAELRMRAHAEGYDKALAEHPVLRFLAHPCAVDIKRNYQDSGLWTAHYRCARGLLRHTPAQVTPYGACAMALYALENGEKT
jgi:hypothetical protein